ncbi:MAG: hypothetical protein Q9165_004569 [Trypethelium subeluteriae]
MAPPIPQQSPHTLLKRYASVEKRESFSLHHGAIWSEDGLIHPTGAVSSTGKGILIGMLSAFGSAALLALIVAIVYFFRHTTRGRIFLDRIGRPGEYDDEQAFAKEETDALEQMDDIQTAEYLRAKAFVQANPPESVQTDISLSQFLAIQEKGVSAWEFEPELEIANCFVEARTEVEFFDSECSVQSNLPIPKQNEVYYWEAKIYEKPENTTIAVGLTTKPYPLFRLPGYHKQSISYVSTGTRLHNQPFPQLLPSRHPTHSSHPPFAHGDVIGCGYRPRTGTVFFTRNGKKLEDVAHGLKTQNFFPTIGATGPATVHVNLGQLGFVYIEANVKKWGLAPMVGSLAPPPPYGSEAGSILLEGGGTPRQESPQDFFGNVTVNTGNLAPAGQGLGRLRSGSYVRSSRNLAPTSPGPQRSPTDISLAQLSLIDSREGFIPDEGQDDAGEGNSNAAAVGAAAGAAPAEGASMGTTVLHPSEVGLGFEGVETEAPPEYESPESHSDEDHDDLYQGGQEEQSPLIQRQRRRNLENTPPIPSYEAAVGTEQEGTPTRGRERSDTIRPRR